MKTLTLNLDYKLKEVTEEKKVELTISYLEAAINSVYREGLEGQMRRLYGRIQRKFDEVIDGKLTTIELEDTEFDFLNKGFETAKYSPHVAKYVDVLEEEMKRVNKI